MFVNIHIITDSTYLLTFTTELIYLLANDVYVCIPRIILLELLQVLLFSCGPQIEYFNF